MKRSKKTKIWLNYWQEEIDAAFLYKKLAKKIQDPVKQQRYSSLASVEEKHVLAWEKLLEEEAVSIPRRKPSLNAKFKLWLSRYFGLGLLEQMMLQEESKEVKSYIGLYKTSSDTPTKKIALKLARDSAGHAEKLTDTLGENQEPWHKTGSGGSIARCYLRL